MTLTPANGITSIRYINLAKNWHRNLFIKLLLRGLPFPVLRYDGVIFKGNEEQYSSYVKHGIFNLLGKERQPGVAGCWIAHSKVIEDVTDTEGITVVLEDDFVCKADFFETALEMIRTFSQEFDIIVFDPWGQGPVAVDRITENVYAPREYGYPYYAGAHCLFVNNASIQKILSIKLNSQITDFDRFLIESRKLNVYLFYTGKCAARGIGSDITPAFPLQPDLTTLLWFLAPARIREKSTTFQGYFKSAGYEKKILKISDETLALYCGYYRDPVHPKVHLQISMHDEGLALSEQWHDRRVQFHPESETDFFSKDFPYTLSFIRNADGTIKEVKILDKHVYAKNNQYTSSVKKSITLSAPELQRFQGIYQDNNNIKTEVHVESETLLLKLWDGTPMIFIPESEHTFFYKGNHDFFIRFDSDSDGNILRLVAFDTHVSEKL
jgi:GR25 family glycosyltransferase involved in LPS biosynthesis